MRNNYEVRGEVTAIFLNRKDGTILEALISTSDLEKANEFPNSWVPTWCKETNSFRAIGKTSRSEGHKTVSLHRWILDNPEGMVIDHINHDTLNNTRNNLRIVTKAQNNQNKKQRNSKSGIRGVYWNESASKWEVRIGLNYKKLYFGTFDNLDDAKAVSIEVYKKYMPFSMEG